jgi:hypothetical protein
MAPNLKSSWLAGPVSFNRLETNVLEASLLEAHLLENRCSRPLSLKLLKVNPYLGGGYVVFGQNADWGPAQGK